ncbi:MAG: hypothetical protein KC505_04950 [Myxococcales bacterium]|nr:hypothetical protein [Myxococcales bacterium]USN51420.1 MAG: hypothetical protein H6731_03155 [Myxococcales bacterium]
MVKKILAMFFMLCFCSFGLNARAVDYEQRIRELFEIQNESQDKAHRFSNDRLKFLRAWVLGKKGSTNKLWEKELKLSEIAHQDDITARLEFLENYWAHDFFRAFDRVEGAANYLKSSSGVNYIVRLSTTFPGYVTISRKIGKKILHARIRLDASGNFITDGDDCYSFDQLLSQYCCSNCAPYVIK